jgi:hypothetical protein
MAAFDVQVDVEASEQGEERPIFQKYAQPGSFAFCHPVPLIIDSHTRQSVVSRPRLTQARGHIK